VDRVFLFANIGMLACVAFIPFPTSLVAEHFRDDGLKAATVTYAATLCATAVFMNSGWYHAAKNRRLIREDVDQAIVDRLSRYAAPGIFGCCAGVAIAFWNPYVTLALTAGFVLFYIVGGPTADFIESAKDAVASDREP
jgi:uncharacterized membrane protein